VFADPTYPFEARKWNELSVFLATTAAEKNLTGGRSIPNRPIELSGFFSGLPFPNIKRIYGNCFAKQAGHKTKHLL
jgi:hypothetical protein